MVIPPILLINYYFARELRKELITDRTRLNRSAHQNPSTLNPGMIAEASKTSNAFITNVKSQKVKMLMGRVKMISTGLTNVFRAPRITATMTAVKKFSIRTPGRI
jgi:hypothetical protein